MERKYFGWAAGILTVSVLVTIYLYPRLPSELAVHWSGGQPDGYMSRFWGAALLPLIIVGVVGLFAVLPRIDPLRENIQEFKEYYGRFFVLLAGFLAYLQFVVLAFNLGLVANVTAWLAPALGVLLYFVGMVLQRSERNWFLGVRTPWTLSSDRVWRKTNELVGKLLKASAFFAAAGMFFPRYMTYLVAVPLASAAFYAFVYSYLVYRRENQCG